MTSRCGIAGCRSSCGRHGPLLLLQQVLVVQCQQRVPQAGTCEVDGTAVTMSMPIYTAAVREWQHFVGLQAVAVLGDGAATGDLRLLQRQQQQRRQQHLRQQRLQRQCHQWPTLSPFPSPRHHPPCHHRQVRPCQWRPLLLQAQVRRVAGGGGRATPSVMGATARQAITLRHPALRRASGARQRHRHHQPTGCGAWAVRGHAPQTAAAATRAASLTATLAPLASRRHRAAAAVASGEVWG